MGSAVFSVAFTRILRTRSWNIRNLIICILYFLESFKPLFSSSFQMKVTLKIPASLTVLRGKRDRSIHPVLAFSRGSHVLGLGPGIAPGITVVETEWTGIPKDRVETLIVDINCNITRNNHFLQSRHIASLTSRDQ